MIWFLVILGLLIYLFWPVIRLFIGVRSARNRVRDAFRQAAEQSENRQRSYSSQHQARKKRKIIGKDVGEYVDFEEVTVYSPAADGTATEAQSVKFQVESQVEDVQWEDIN